MIKMDAIVQNGQGIHCRPSAVIIKEVGSYPGKVIVTCERGHSDLRSVMSLLQLGLIPGTQVSVSVTGPDEEDFCQKLVDLFQKHYDFPPRDTEKPMQDFCATQPSEDG